METRLNMYIRAWDIRVLISVGCSSAVPQLPSDYMAGVGILFICSNFKKDV